MRRIRYIQDLPDWPGFRFDRTGLTGRLESLGFPQQQEAVAVLARQ